MYLALERYSRPTSVGECLSLLGEPEGVARILAGGTELNVRGHEDVTHVVDIQELHLREIEVQGNTLEIGALVTLTELRRHDAFRGQLLSGLREAAAGYAVLGIQNRSTVGGRVMIGRGDQDLPPALLALGAKLRMFCPGDGFVEERLIDYPLGDARAVLRGALLVGLQLPLGSGRSAHRRFGRSAVDRPLANASCAVRGRDVRLAANVQGPDAASLRRLTSTEALVASWNGERPQEWRNAARESAKGELTAFGDAWASGDYRQDLAATLAVRALAAALGEDEIQ